MSSWLSFYAKTRCYNWKRSNVQSEIFAKNFRAKFISFCDKIDAAIVMQKSALHNTDRIRKNSIKFRLLIGDGKTISNCTIKSIYMSEY